MAKACEAHVFDFFLSVFSYRIDPKVPSVDIMLRADAARPVKVPEVQYHCNATLPGQETFCLKIARVMTRNVLVRFVSF